VHQLVRHEDVAKTTRGLVFEGRTWTWRELPRQTRALAHRVDRHVADGAAEDGRFYEAGGHLVRVVRGWRADKSGLYVAVACQPVEIVGDRVVEAEPLRHLSLHRYDAAEPARRRLGVVPPGVVLTSPRVEHGFGTAPASDTPPEHDAAAGAWPHLPGAVRKSAERAVPVPEDWIGSLVQRWATNGRLPVSQEILTLRRAVDAAVVVRARRELGAEAPKDAEARAALLAEADWAVEQVTFSLRVPRLLGPALPPEPFPWA